MDDFMYKLHADGLARARARGDAREEGRELDALATYYTKAGQISEALNLVDESIACLEAVADGYDSDLSRAYRTKAEILAYKLMDRWTAMSWSRKAVDVCPPGPQRDLLEEEWERIQEASKNWSR